MDDGRFPTWLRRPTMMAANSMYLLAIAGSVILQFALGYIATLLPEAAGESMMWLQAYACELLFILLPSVLYALPRKGVSVALRLNPPQFKLMAAAALSGPIMALFSTALGGLWYMLIEALGGRSIPSSIPVPENVSQLAGMVLPVVILPAVCEEVLFRGTILSAWERRGARAAILASGLLFAAVHPFDGLPVYVLAGLTLGFIAVASDSLYVSMTFHSAYNLSALAISMVLSQQAASAGLDASAEMAFDPIYVVVYGVAALLLGALFMGTLLPFFEAMRRRSLTFPRTDAERGAMDWPEYIVLAVGIATAAILYAWDLWQMFGPVAG